MSSFTYPPHAIPALKRALTEAYWYKTDLRSFLAAAEVPPNILANQPWDQYKAVVAASVIDDLLKLGDVGLGSLRRITRSLLEIPNFDHLKRLEDGTRRVQIARECVEALRQVVAMPRPSPQRSPKAHFMPSIQNVIAVLRPDLKERFVELAACDDVQKRGFLFEKFLRDLFEAHDLKPRGSFRISGEQLDGSFELDGTSFLLEAKWTNGPEGAAALDAFSGKVERKLDNTLGLFISFNGFTREGLQAFQRGKVRIVLMDGEDITLALEGLIDFVEMLRRKKRHAADTGNPFLAVREILA